MKMRVTLTAEFTCVVEAEDEDDAFDQALERAQNRQTNWSSNEPQIEEVEE